MKICNRSVDVKQNESGGFTALAVPYNQATRISDWDGDYDEIIAPGAIDCTRTGILFYGHDRERLPIGKWSLTDSDDGPIMDATLSATGLGIDVRALINDQVLTSVSIGFVPIRSTTTRGSEDGQITITRDQIDLVEISVVPFPAYDAARITESRSNQGEPTMKLEEAIEEHSRSIADLDRRMNVAMTSTPAAAPVVKHRSLGEFIKSLAGSGADREALRRDAQLITEQYRDAQQFRAYTGGKLADASVITPFIQRDLTLVDKNRSIINLFPHESLPADAMDVTYPEIASTTDGTGIQKKEGDTLGYVGLKITNKTVSADTYGNYAQLSRQAIERAPISYLNKVLDFQKLAYGKATNLAVRDALLAITGANAIDAAKTSTKASGIVGALIDANMAIHDNSVSSNGGDFLLVTGAFFKQLMTMEDTTGRLQFAIRPDSANSIGDLSVRELSGAVASVPVYWCPGLTGIHAYLVSADAMTVLEDGPFNLDGDDVINLTKAFSLHGYLAMTINDPKAIAKIAVSG